MKKKILNQIKHKLIVSTQAREGWPMYGSNIMAAFAHAAEIGGACAIRATGVDTISEIKKKVNLPVLGINKKWSESFDVYITPTIESAKEILDLGIEMIAIDATLRERPNQEQLKDIIDYIKINYPNVLLVGDISTQKEAILAEELGCDCVATTLNGYTEESIQEDLSNLELMKLLKQTISIPIIAEGKVHTPMEAKQMIDAGAHSVVVGTAITRPEIITKNFVSALNDIK